MVLQVGGQFSLLDCGHILADRDGRSCDYAVTGCDTNETRISGKLVCKAEVIAIKIYDVVR